MSGDVTAARPLSAGRPGGCWWSGIDAGLFAFGLWLSAMRPLAFVGGTYDDYHFVAGANALLDGHWLGPFDKLTLAKGPFYPAFLAAAAVCGIPVQLATQGVYLLGALMLCRALATVTASRASGSLCFLLLVLNPTQFDTSSMLLLREPLYSALTLLVIGLAAKSFLCRSGSIWPAGLGLAIAAFWLTREEGIVLLPALALLALLAIWSIWPEDASQISRHPFRQLVRLVRSRNVKRLAVVLVTAVLPVFLVAVINARVYGVFRVNDFNDGPYVAAYGALARISQQHPQRYVPVPHDARLRAYSVSAAARELEPFLEGTIGQFWTRTGCGQHPIPHCADIQAGWFIWALRDAVSAAGHYRSAREADDFYRALAAEVDHACDEGRISCQARRDSLMPLLHFADLPALAVSAFHILSDALALGPVQLVPPPSNVEAPMADRYQRVAAATRVTPTTGLADATGWYLNGWIVSSAKDLALSVGGPPRTAVASRVRFHSDPGLNGALQRHDSVTERFDISAHCQPADCALKLTRDGVVVGQWPLASLRPGWLVNQSDIAMLVDDVTPLPTGLTLARQPHLQDKVARILVALMPMLAMPALPLAVLWVAWRVVCDVRRRSMQPMTALVAAVTLAVLSRVLLLALLDATAWGTELRYELPIIALALFLIGCFLQALPLRRAQTLLILYLYGPAAGRNARTDSKPKSR